MMTFIRTRALLGILVVFCVCGILLLQNQTYKVTLKRLNYIGKLTQASRKQQQPYDLKQHTEIFRDDFHGKALNESHIDIFIFSAFVTEQPSLSIAGDTVTENCFVEKSNNTTHGNIKGLKACGREENTTVRQEESTVFEIHINGWEHKDYKHETVKCCYLLETGEVSEFLNPSRSYYLEDLTKSVLCSVHYKCVYLSRFKKIQGVHIQTHNGSCNTVKHRFVKPLSPRRPKYNGMTAVCLKIVYGAIDLKWLIEWFEYYKELKVDNVFLTTYNVSKDVHKVIQYYVAEGFVEAVPFDFPWKNRLKRNLEEEETMQVWDDENVVVLDFSARYKEYSFTSVIDVDEFLVPSEGDLKTLMVITSILSNCE